MGEERGILNSKTADKVVSLSEAVSFIEDGHVVGLGGFTLSRTQTALAHEIIRQGKRDLTLVSTSVSMQMDLMVAGGCVRRIEHGAASIERFGLTYNFRRAVERREIEVEDFTHLGMASRFLAGEMGLPFIPVKGYLGTDLEKRRLSDQKMAVIEDPFDSNRSPVVLLPACNPDVAILHVQKADRSGNILIEGCTFHEVQLARAAEKVIVTCEELVPTEFFLLDPERTTLPFIYVSAVVHRPWGSYPTCCYGYYDYDREHIQHYQSLARTDEFDQYLERFVYDTDFDGFLQQNLSSERAEELKRSMDGLIYGGEQ
ncbi:MAG: CoA-transferase [Bacillota bacterium]